jgi:ABC-2 type transport system permease protein
MTEPVPTAWTLNQTRSQFLSIAWLRWRILVNGFRRKGGAGELIARILVWPILFGMAFGPSILVALGAYYFASSHHLDHIAWLLWGTFALCQLLNIQLGQPGSTFDPTQLIRFPLGVAGYTGVRLFFGLLSPANVIGTLMAFAIALGILIAAPGLWLYTLVGLGVFAAANVLFSRMVFAWVDRWLSTRRAREIFSGLAFVFALGVQYLNFTFNPAYNRGHGAHAPTQQHLVAGLRFYHRIRPFLAALPPELTTRSLIAARHGNLPAYLGLTLGCAAFGLFFLAVFALRMRSEFRGESLSDAANAVAKPARRAAVVAHPANAARPTALHPADGLDTLASAPARGFRLPPVVLAQFGKEILYVRRNQGVLYALVMPLFIAAIACMRFAARGSAAWIFPAILAYTLLGLIPLSYNSFGLEGAGSQFYFLAPVRMRDVLLGKNLTGFSLAALEVLAVFAIVAYVSHLPSLATVAASLLWAAGTLLFSTALGNRRSITAPKRINPARMSRNQASPLSGLISVGIMLLSVGFAGALFGLALWFQRVWVLVPVFAAFAAAGLWVYLRTLSSMDRFVLEHREQLFEELCKAG